jgi:hypothetical protein
MTIKRAEVEQGEWEFSISFKPRRWVPWRRKVRVDPGDSRSLAIYDDFKYIFPDWDPLLEARPKGSKQPFQRVRE